MSFSIVPIVEGKGELESVRVLIYRLLQQQEIFHVKIDKAIKVHRYKVVKEGELERYIKIAISRENCQAILVILDAGDDCPWELAPKLLKRAQSAAPDIYVGVVLPKPEFEIWFAAGIESLRGMRGIINTATQPSNPVEEAFSDAKGWLSENMQRPYKEVDDQPAFADKFDMEHAQKKCRSFQKLCKELNAIIERVKRDS